ncbi:MAG TPA: ATP-binding cassette domain-containing protein, partial [Burkholderiaceae bacterium]|nr:ATP-binding cassette domain-containing protein [Burkholderiaceae bacterium]
MTKRAETVLEVDSVVTRFGEQKVHDGVSFNLQRGTLTALIGGSGTGKSVLLREIIGLQRPTSGRIRLLGTDVWQDSAEQLNAMRRRFGMMFQDGALFSSMTVAQNVAVPLLEHSRVPAELLESLVKLRLLQAGLGPDAAEKMPSELSGGMRKRAG